MAHSAFERMTLEQLLEKVSKTDTDGKNRELVEKAWRFAEEAHAGQTRKSGEPYIVHPTYVASIIADLMNDPPTIAAALLHDTVEDCEGVTLQIIQERFGSEVAMLVDGVTKINRLDVVTREEQQAESLRKMILAMGRDIRVVLIKLADRLHNMRTLEYKTADRQLAIAQETLDIYAPLAHRLGVYTIKQELEDLAFRYLHPEEYKDIAQRVGMKRQEREKSIETVIDELSRKLDEAGIKYEITGRPKHLYSIYHKMYDLNRPFDQIFDLIAIRVIVETKMDCYTVLGITHMLWTQVPGRFKDYISVPKANMYQSLHTTVVGGRQNPFPFEVQIRTREMHRIAEYGIAAHWRYKEGKPVDTLDQKLYWLRQILDWQSETSDSREFMEGLKTDLFAEEVLMFTPKGDIITMPRGATPLDFAYRIHSQVGNRCIGARVNGKMVPLDTTLETGDNVEIITGNNAKPSLDWLKVVKTQQAKAKIRQFLKREFRGENIMTGRDMLEHEAKRRGMKLPDLTKPEYYEPVLSKYMFQELDDIYGAVGAGALTAAHVIARLIDEKQKTEAPAAPRLPVLNDAPVPRPQGKPTHGIFVHGEPGMLVRFARCCSPIPGDDIVGYITRGRGVTIHKADCVNAQHGESERAVPVSWAMNDNKNERFPASIQVICTDHKELLAEITRMMDDMGMTLTGANARLDKDNHVCSLTLTTTVSSREQLDEAIRKLKRRSDVIEAYRGVV